MFETDAEREPEGVAEGDTDCDASSDAHGDKDGAGVFPNRAKEEEPSLIDDDRRIKTTHVRRMSRLASLSSSAATGLLPCVACRALRFAAPSRGAAGLAPAASFFAPGAAVPAGFGTLGPKPPVKARKPPSQMQRPAVELVSAVRPPPPILRTRHITAPRRGPTRATLNP